MSNRIDMKLKSLLKEAPGDKENNSTKTMYDELAGRWLKEALSNVENARNFCNQHLHDRAMMNELKDAFVIIAKCLNKAKENGWKRNVK